MNELLVAKDVLLNAKIGGGLISGINEVNQLAAGALAVFTDNNVMLTNANANTVFTTSPNKKRVYFALGSGDATLGAKISQLVDRETTNVQFKYYVAPVKQVVLIGADGTVTGSMNIATPVAGTYAYLRIIDTTEDNINLVRAERYSYLVKTGDTAALVVAGLVAECNLNLSSKYTVTAVNTNQGITVAENNFGKTFEVALDGIISAATITTDGTGASTIIEFGSGASTEVALIESEFNSEDGNTSRLHLAPQYWKKASDVVTGATYDLMNIQWKQVHTNPINTQPATDKQIIVAIPTNPSTFLSAHWNTIIKEAFGVNSVNAETGSN